MKRISNIIDYENTLLQMWSHAESFVAIPDRSKIGTFLREVAFMSGMGLQFYATINQWIDLISKCASGGIIQKIMANNIAAALSEDETMAIPFDQLRQWRDESIASKRNESAKRLEVSMIKRYPLNVSVEDIRELCRNVFNDDIDRMCDIQTTAVESGIEGITEQDVITWLQSYIPDTSQNIPGRWDLYHKLALAVVNKREVDETGKLLKQAIPGIPEAEESRLILDWCYNLDRAGESALALDLYWAAYQKAVTGTTVEGVQAFIKVALGQSGGGFVQTGYGAGTEVKGEVRPDLAIEIAAAFIQKHGNLLRPDTIFEWNDKTTPKVASISNSERIMVAALQNEALRERLDSGRLASVVQGCIDLAVARRTPAFYVEAARVAAAAVETGFAGKDQANAWVAEHKEYGALCEAQPLLLAMWQRRQEFNLPLTLLQEGMNAFVSMGNYDGALKFAQAALAQGAPLERASILDLAARIGA
ncbi:MAG: hypothetical protein FJZ96_15615, partial [Chloroflexi bacterium]|nr:hypothetical protein [Chloroflexota bacterium]